MINWNELLATASGEYLTKEIPVEALVDGDEAIDTFIDEHRIHANEMDDIDTIWDNIENCAISFKRLLVSKGIEVKWFTLR